METNINLMSINKQEEDEEEEQWREKNLKILNLNKKCFTDICHSSSIFIVLIIITIIPISQLAIGWRYVNACPINQSIPHYLIVAGIAGLILVILFSITQIISRTFSSKIFDNVIDRTISNQRTKFIDCTVCSIMCINLSLLIFLLGWSVVGWIWIIETLHRVQYHRVQNIDYCHPILYQFTFSFLLITTSFKIILFCCVCRRTCIRLKNIRRTDIITSEDF